MRRSSLLLLIFFLVFPLQALVQLRLRPQVRVKSRVIRVRDIASGVSGAAGVVVLARIPTGSSRARLKYSRLKEALNRIFSVPVIVIGGDVLVSLIRTPVTEKVMAACVRRRLQAGQETVQVQLRQAAGPLLVDGRFLSLQMNGEPAKQADGTYLVSFTAVGSGSTRTFHRLFTIKRIYHGWRLAQDLPAGHKLVRSDFVRVVVREAGRRTHYRHLLGKILLRKLHKGSLPKAEDIVKTITVRAGQMVRVVYSAPGITFEFTGRAVESGGDGDTVRVRNAFTGKMVAVRVGMGGAATLTGGE